jgi:hypothetical protein
MGLSGDDAKLARLVDRLRRAPGLVRQATDAVRDGVAQEYRQDFTAARSPWGETWPARKDGSGGSPLQGPTGALAGAAPTASGGAVRLRPPRYWALHQIGANNMHQRAVLPFGPSNWDSPILSRVDGVVAEHFNIGSED